MTSGHAHLLCPIPKPFFIIIFIVHFHLPCQSHTFDPRNPYCDLYSYFEFPKLKKGGYIVRLSSTISRKLYSVESSKSTVTVTDVHPRAAASVKLDVAPKKRREEINSSSFFSLLTAAVVVLTIVYNNK